MKKNLLTVACLTCLFLSCACKTFSAEVQPQQMNTDFKQKACQNVFSLVNIDLSFLSPRAAAADVTVAPPIAPDNKKGAVVPVAAKQEAVKPVTPIQNRTSLFRIDLLHLFKIQVL